MSKSGRWSQQVEFRNCGKESCQQGCVLNSETKPHGPYASLRRRNPDTGNQERVYLGKKPLTRIQLAIINETLTGPVAPTKEAVHFVLREAREIRTEKPA